MENTVKGRIEKLMISLKAHYAGLIDFMLTPSYVAFQFDKGCEIPAGFEAIVSRIGSDTEEDEELGYRFLIVNF